MMDSGGSVLSHHVLVVTSLAELYRLEHVISHLSNDLQHSTQLITRTELTHQSACLVCGISAELSWLGQSLLGGIHAHTLACGEWQKSTFSPE